MKVFIDMYNRPFQNLFYPKGECPPLTSALTCIAMYQGFSWFSLPGMGKGGVKTDFASTSGEMHCEIHL